MVHLIYLVKFWPLHSSISSEISAILRNLQIWRDHAFLSFIKLLLLECILFLHFQVDRGQNNFFRRNLHGILQIMKVCVTEIVRLTYCIKVPVALIKSSLRISSVLPHKDSSSHWSCPLGVGELQLST
jgi:hypothetical protein